MQHTLSPHKILTYIASYINSKYALQKKKKENLFKKTLAKLTMHFNNYHKNARKKIDMLSNPKIFLNHTLCFPTENFKMKNRP